MRIGSSTKFSNFWRENFPTTHHFWSLSLPCLLKRMTKWIMMVLVFWNHQVECSFRTSEIMIFTYGWFVWLLGVQTGILNLAFEVIWMRLSAFLLLSKREALRLSVSITPLPWRQHDTMIDSSCDDQDFLDATPKQIECLNMARKGGKCKVKRLLVHLRKISTGKL